MAKTHKLKQLTNSPNSPAVDKLPSTESKVLESEILQLSFPRLKAIVGKENNGSIIPETGRGDVLGVNKKTKQNNESFTSLYILNSHLKCCFVTVG